MATYNPKSLKAEEFIHHGEILDTIAYAKANKDNVELIDRLLEKARPKKTEAGITCSGLSHREGLITEKRLYFLPVKFPKRWRRSANWQRRSS